MALSEAELLRSAGYDVTLWGMDYPDNLSSPDSGLYAPRVRFDGSMADKMKAMGRSLGVGDIRKSFASVLEQVKPDTVHFHNIHSYLSPVIVEMAKAAGIRTLWTMHDYKIVCPSYSCLTPDLRPCLECISRPTTVMTRRCMKGSLTESVAAWAEAKRWSIERLVRATDLFICPSVFMRSTLMSGGVPPYKTAVVGNFISPAKQAIFEKRKNDSERVAGRMLYVGRLSREKGVVSLLKTYREMADPRFSLRLFGSGPLERELCAEFGALPGVEFMGHADAATIADELTRAEMLVCPSECYENNPLSVIEALSAGTPVLGADIGGIPELITPGDGLLFEPGDRYAMAGAIRGMHARSFSHDSIRKSAADRFSAERHLSLLTQLL